MLSIVSSVYYQFLVFIFSDNIIIDVDGKYRRKVLEDPKTPLWVVLGTSDKWRHYSKIAPFNHEVSKTYEIIFVYHDLCCTYPVFRYLKVPCLIFMLSSQLNCWYNFLASTFSMSTFMINLRSLLFLLSTLTCILTYYIFF